MSHRISRGAGGTGQRFYRSRWVRVSKEMGGIGQRSGWVRCFQEWVGLFLKERDGLVRASKGARGTGQRNGWARYIYIFF